MNDICGINNLFRMAMPYANDNRALPYTNDDRALPYPNDVGFSTHTFYPVCNSKNEIIMQKSNQKITRRAESPVINSVGQRPTREYANTNPLQRGVIGIIGRFVYSVGQFMPMMIGRCPLFVKTKTVQILRLGVFIK